MSLTKRQKIEILSATINRVDGNSEYEDWRADAITRLSTLKSEVANEDYVGFFNDSWITDNIAIAIVTNTDADGLGSLKDILSNIDGNTPTVVVFSVGGEIDATSSISIPSNTWLAGQSAPAPGITIKNTGVFISGKQNVLVEHIRSRVGTKYMGGVFDDFVLSSGTVYESSNPIWERYANAAHVQRVWVDGVELTRNLVGNADTVGEFALNVNTNKLLVNDGTDITGKTIGVDLNKSLLPDALNCDSSDNFAILNCSFSHGGDILCFFDNCTNWDFKNNIVAECLNFPWHPKSSGAGNGNHSKGLLAKRDGGETGNTNILIDSNLFIRNDDRNPRVSDGDAVISNNIQFDCDIGISIDTRDELSNGTSAIDISGNVSLDDSGNNPLILNDGAGSIYFAPNNYYSGQVQTDPINSSGNTTFETRQTVETIGATEPDLETWEEDSVLSPENLSINTAFENISLCIDNMGAFPKNRDVFDERYIYELQHEIRKSTPKTEADIENPTILETSHNIEWESLDIVDYLKLRRIEI